MANEVQQLRVLVVDDEISALDMYRNIFASPNESKQLFSELELMAGRLFGKKTDIETSISFQLELCEQGDLAVKAVQKSIDEKRPFAMAFLDVRMPPGPDGIWVAEQISRLDPHLIIIIVTGYSDIHPSHIARRISSSPHQLFYIHKPMHPHELYQFATALSEKWLMQREIRQLYCDLEDWIESKTAQLREANRQLQLENLERCQLLINLENKSRHLEEINTALNVLLAKREEDRAELEEKIHSNIDELVMPYIGKLKNTNLDERQANYLMSIEAVLNKIVSPFAKVLSTGYMSFTPTEIQVANWIKQGRSSKEIADALGLSVRTIETHRKNIRKKMRISNCKKNLRTQLMNIN